MITTYDVRCGLRRAAPGLRRAATASTAGSRSRSTRGWPTTPTTTVAEARAAVVAGRPAQPVHQDPGDQGRACRRSPQCLAEGISVNVTLIFSLERYGEVMDAFLDGLERARATGHDLTDLASVASFFVSPGRHRGRQAARQDRHRRGQGAARARPRSPTPGSPTRLYEEVFGTDRWQALAAAGRQAAAAAVGLDRRQGPGVRRHAVRRRPGRARHRQHDARGDPRRGRRPRQSSAATPSAATYARRRKRCSTTLAAVGIDYDDVVAGARGRGRREVRGVLERAARVDRRPSWSRLAAETASDRRRSRPARASCGSRRRCRRSRPGDEPGRDGVAGRLVAKDADAVGAGGASRRPRSGSAGSTCRESLAAAAAPSSRALRERAAAAGSTTSCSPGWAARRSRPRSSPAPPASPLTVLDTHRPAPGRRGARRPARPHRRGRLVQERRHGRDRQPPPGLRAGVPRRRRSTRRSASSSSPTPARRWRRPRREAGYRTSFLADPNVGGRYSALTAFGLVPSALAGADVERAARPTRAVLAADARPTTRTTRRSRSARRSAAPRVAGHDKLVLADAGSGHRRLRRLGRAADRRVDRQGGQGHPAGRRRGRRRARASSRPADDAIRVVLGAGRRRPGRHAAVGGSARRAVPALGVRHRRRRARSSASTRSTSPTCRSPRTTPRRSSTRPATARCPRASRRSSTARSRCTATSRPSARPTDLAGALSRAAGARCPTAATSR